MNTNPQKVWLVLWMSEGQPNADVYASKEAMLAVWEIDDDTLAKAAENPGYAYDFGDDYIVRYATVGG